jgi:hydroxymethylglutaryl-CoA lyase
MSSTNESQHHDRQVASPGDQPVSVRDDRQVASPGDRQVTIVEVSARDGIQAEPVLLSTAQKIRLVQRAEAAGLRRLEAVSFVNPARVPQMADSAELMAALNTPGTLADRSAVSLIGLVLNARGLQQAIDTGVDEINVVVVLTDTFATKNQGRTTMELVDVWHGIGSAARDAGLRTSVTLAASFGCPYEGEVADDRFGAVVEAVMQVAPDELAAADSIGVGVPTDVRRRVALMRELAPDTQLRCHFHNTRNTGLANAAAAVEAGVRVLDASLGGVGGCNFAPNATGNVPTEDLAYMLERMGYPTGLDLQRAIDTIPWIEEIVEHGTPGLLAKAGLFPRSATAALS